MLEDFPIDSLPKTSAITFRRFKKLEVCSYWDLLNYFPFRYENYATISPLDRLQEGEIVTVKGVVTAARNEYTRKGLTIQKVTITDNGSELVALWYNQPFLLRLLRAGSFVSLSGEVKKFSSRLIIEPHEYEVIRDETSPTVHTGRIVPVYSEKNGLSSRTIREKIFYLTNLFLKGKEAYLEDFLPEEIRKQYRLMDEYSAYMSIHFPQSYRLEKEAQRRLSFDELSIMQLAASLIRREWQTEKTSNNLAMNKEIRRKLYSFIDSFPFKLTGAQEKAIKEILDDMSRGKPMNRLLQGDVGSGKTVVAAVACYFAFLNGYQSLIMAPTELLANQHYKTIIALFKNYLVKIGLQTSANKSAHDSSDIVIGTHALLNPRLNLKRTALVIVDEQHRFGVKQRARLKEHGYSPHLLSMTATPIPRTVALVFYNELEMSIIDEMPEGRLPVKTFLVSMEKRKAAYQWIRDQIASHKIQVFIVCPFIEESSIETLKSVRAATKEYLFLKESVFQNESIALLHGKMKSKEKDRIMNEFKNKKISILVTTPLVEVGIDIPNASVMIIEGAERFGLAQLHQLRGRVGRGSFQSYCFLFSSSFNHDPSSRLQFFCRTHNGIALSEFDLEKRGQGELFGTRQHGFSELKIASLSDTELVLQSKEAARYFLNNDNELNANEILQKRLKEFSTLQIAHD